jgi:tetratricopeptide (TPR) repeat protein
LPFSCAFGSNFGIPPLLQSVYLASQFKGFLTYYLRCSVLPFGLSIEPPFFVSPGWADPYAALGLGALFILGFLIFLKKEDRFLAFSLAVVGLGYLPSLLISRSEYVNDGRFYIPLVGVCLVLARVLYSLVKKAPLIGRTALVSTIILLASLTFWREAAWGSSLEVWKAANQLHRSAHSEAMIALLKIKSVNAEEARSQALSLIQKYPDCQPAYLALAVYENSRGDFSSSAGYFARALRLCHEQHLNDQTYFTTATLCLRNLVELDDYTFPLEEISTLIANYSGCAEVNYLAGRLALHQNKPMVAVRYLDKAFSLDRVNPDYVEALAQACVDSEDDKLIENAYKSTRYISLRVPSPTLRIICAQAALEMGRPDQCIEFVSKAINVFDKLSQAYAIRPKLKAKAYYLKSIALSTIGKTIESEAAQKEALHYDPAVVSHVRIKIVGKDQSSSASSEKNSGVRFPPKTL